MVELLIVGRREHGTGLLDVLEHEQNFEENKELISHPRVVTTPHIAFYADDSMRNMFLDSFQSIDEWLAGVRLRRRGPQPTLSDSEVLTIECVGEFLGIDTDKGLYEHFRRISLKIRITNETIDIERGLFGKRIDTIQLWRVRDIDFRQSVVERQTGAGR